jgi:mono/diheme cytochrome c family protein
MLKRILKWAALVIAVIVIGGASFLTLQVRAFNKSTARVYDVALRQVTLSTDSTVLARGKHLAESLGECTACHGPNLGGGAVEDLGPLGNVTFPNITTGREGRLAAYSDGELARLIKHGIKRDGRTVRFMPSQNTAWWPDDDVSALVSWLRVVPPVDGTPGAVNFTAMAKVLDRFNAIPVDVARRIDHVNPPTAPAPAPDAQYGQFVAMGCRGCHGETLAGGPIPGAPATLAVPLNLTAHETGLKDWTYEDFMSVIRAGKRKDGRALDPFMPVQNLRAMNETETRALWAYLQSLPPRPLGAR